MKAFLVRSGIRLAPFDDPPDQALVLNRSVGEKRAEILNRLDLEVVPVNSIEEIRDTEFIVMWDYVYCSQACLKSFLRTVSRHQQSRRLALESNPQIEMSLPMQDLHVLPPVREGGPEIYGFDLFYVCESDFDASRLSQIAPEVVPAKMRVAEVDPPLYVRIKDKNRIGISRTYCMHLKHWTHIYLLNYAALTGLPLEWFPRRLLWFLWRVLTAFSLNRYRLLKRLVVKGKRCSVHPTAVVEASVLGDHVSIGPHAVVRGSYIGDGVQVSEAAKVLGSIVGEECVIAWNAVVNLCVLYPRSCIGIPGLQAALAGREAYLSSMVLPLDVKFKGGYVSVRHRGETVTTRFTTLGPCLGHRVRVGAGVTINCGREIPNDVDILPASGAMLSRMPEDLIPGRAYVVQQGTLVQADWSIQNVLSRENPEGLETG